MFDFYLAPALCLSRLFRESPDQRRFKLNCILFFIYEECYGSMVGNQAAELNSQHFFSKSPIQPGRPAFRQAGLRGIKSSWRKTASWELCVKLLWPCGKTNLTKYFNKCLTNQKFARHYFLVYF